LPDQKKKGRVFSDWKKNIPEKGEPYLYLSKGISNIDWANRPENAIRQFVKEKLELIIREEIKNFLEIEQEDTSNMRNGYYQRSIITIMMLGHLPAASIPPVFCIFTQSLHFGFPSHRARFILLSIEFTFPADFFPLPTNVIVFTQTRKRIVDCDPFRMPEEK
jgi:hypothetical protein